MNDNSSRIIDVDINEILPNRFQPRIQFDEDEILELSDSIKEHGVIQPIVVRTIGDKYEIIAGERRYKASVLAGRDTVPVIVKNLNDRDSAEIALIENIQRKNLTPIEEALSYKKILDMGYITQDKLASKLGKSQSTVANKIRLLSLSDDVQEALLENKISERHARSLLRLKKSDLQNQMLKRIISERLTVRRTDEEIDKLKYHNENEEDKSFNERIEEGKINMNNNINMMPNMTSNQEQSTNFGMFGFQPNTTPTEPTTPQFVTPTTPQNFDTFSPMTPSSNINNIQQMQVNEPVQAPEPFNTGAQFDTNGTFNLNSPVSTPTEVQPSQSHQNFNFGQFDLNIPPIGMTETQSVQTPVQPMTQQLVEPQPINTEIQFDSNGMIISEQPSQPQEQSTIPFTSPIIENPSEPLQQNNMNQVNPISENTFAFGTPSEDISNNQIDYNINPISNSNIKMQEPIIVTDYNKQYDPIMPQTEQIVSQKLEFKEVINAIRECSNKIEQYGYKIDVEEFDMNAIYQVIFKIEK